MCVAALLFTASALVAAEIEVAPPPREAGVPLPADEPSSGASVNPAETVERIVKNAKSVGDRLAMTDTGTDTRKTQGQILKDIDDLLKQAQNPPPQKNPDQNQSGGGGGGGSPKSNTGGGGAGGKGGPSAGMKDGRPMGGKQPSGGRPKRDRGGDKGGTEKQPAGGDPKNDPDGKAGGAPKGEPKDGGPGGKDMQPGGNAGGQPNGRTVPMLPIDDEVVKDVWGHLPEKMRQQISEYYKEQFMPGYANLLRQYYSSLAEQNRRPQK